jgi:hypothetical protein
MSEERCLGVGTTGTGITAFEGTPFIDGQSAPHAVVLVGMHGPSQAGVSDLTAAADDFCFVDLVNAGSAFSIGKNNSGFSSRQAARLRHVIRIRLLASKTGESASCESVQPAY